MSGNNPNNVLSLPAIDHLDIWTSAWEKKASGGRGGNGKLSPYGIQKLRELTLDLAVRGRLVPQAPNDEPASVLLEKIVEEKARLVKEGKIRKQKKLPEITEEEKLFELPKGWVWTRLGELTPYGISDKAEAANVPEDTWVLELEDIEKTTSVLLKRVRYSERQFKSTKNRFSAGDVLYGKLRPYLDKVLVADEAGVCTTEIIPIKVLGESNPWFFRLLLKSPEFIKYANESTHGMNLPRLGTEKARLALLAVPPLAEQHRIVAKFDELMAICDRLEQEQTDSRKAHQTLVETLLRTLTDAPNAEAAQQAWQSIAQHFNLLFTTETAIVQLEQTILQLAVMGKLAPQDPNDEPASALLEKIAKEKARLVKEGRIKKPKKLPEITDEEKPFELPESWEWTRLGDISADIHYGYTASANPQINDVRLLRITDIQDDSVAWETVPGCEIDKEKVDGYLLEDGDILIARTGGTIGKSYLVENISVISVFASYLIRVHRLKEMFPAFVKIFLGSQLYWNQLYASSMGTGQPNVNGNALKNLTFALPPLAEQHRIVAKVDELMVLCDNLKARVQEAETTQLQLADAVVEQVVGL